MTGIEIVAWLLVSTVSWLAGYVMGRDAAQLKEMIESISFVRPSGVLHDDGADPFSDAMLDDIDERFDTIQDNDR